MPKLVIQVVCHKANEIIVQKSPAKGNRLKHGINTTGLHKRPQMEQLYKHSSFGHETVRYPDREAKLIRKHACMTQLDFFYTQEDQERKLEGSLSFLTCLLQQRFEQWAFGQVAPKLAFQGPRLTELELAGNVLLLAARVSEDQIRVRALPQQRSPFTRITHLSPSSTTNTQ